MSGFHIHLVGRVLTGWDGSGALQYHPLTKHWKYIADPAGCREGMSSKYCLRDHH